MKWAILIYLAINLVLALIPALNVHSQLVFANLSGIWSVLLSFLFDPTVYVWKWIVTLLVIVAIMFIK
jgi:hypothetical protein